MLTRLRKRQRGQAAVFVFIFTSILIISMLTLYKAGKLTSDKMQLQNAADATAYSASLIEARDLNFAAYMNRAIVANEVAVGQLVGMSSWAIHFQSFSDYLRAYDLAIIGPATLGASTGPINSAATGFNRIVGAGVRIMNKIANFGTIVLHNINKAYGLAEYGYHIVSVMFVIGVLDENIKQNAPPGTKISDFGFVSLIAHIATYGALPGLPGAFSEGFSPTKKVPADEFKQGGYGRLAATIEAGRDPFTNERGWELRPPGFPIDITIGDEVDFFLASVEWELRFHFDLSLQRKGGSELRIIVPSNGKVSGKNFNWSAADATGLFFEVGGGFSLLAKLLGATIVDIGADILVANGKLKIVVDVDGDDFTVVNVPFPTNAPFGSGFAQVGKAPNSTVNPLKMTLDSFPTGTVSSEHYGTSARNLPAWVSPGSGVPGGPNFPLPLGVQFAAGPPYNTVSTVNKSYQGLPHYVDTTGNSSFLDIGAPNLIIGLVLDEPDFDKANNGRTEKEPIGRFEITEDLADDELAVISKSEVYFKRPTDLEYFLRADGQEEVGNAFNPYWHARLIETTYADRIISLLVQQKQDWINLGATFNLFFNKLKSYLPI